MDIGGRRALSSLRPYRAFLYPGVVHLQVNALIARELSGLTCTRSLKMHSKFSIPHSAKPRVVLKLLSQAIPAIFMHVEF